MRRALGATHLLHTVRPAVPKVARGALLPRAHAVRVAAIALKDRSLHRPAISHEQQITLVSVCTTLLPFFSSHDNGSAWCGAVVAPDERGVAAVLRAALVLARARIQRTRAVAAPGLGVLSSLYDLTFSRTVWRLYGGAEGLVMWY
jgi:hypothetical protein